MTFRVPTRTVVGAGSLNQLTRIAGTYSAGTALVVTDPGLGVTELPSRVCGLLETAGFRPWVVEDVTPNPRVAEVDAMAYLARPAQVSVVIGLGGGSVLDAAKGVSLLLTNPGSIGDYEGKNRFSNPAAPFIAIPTTCGTGSEVTWVSVLSDEGKRRKISVKGDGLFPAWAIVDSETLASLPPHLIATTGMDAVTHALEAVTGKASNPISDQLGIAALRLLISNLERAAGHPLDREAQDAVMRGSTLAGMSFGNADVGAVHCLSEAIGGRHDLPHGLLNAALLNPVFRYFEAGIAKRLAWITDQVGGPPILERLQALADSLGIPAFASLNVPPDDYRAIAQAAETNGSNQSAPVEMTHADYRAILTGLG